MRVLAYAALAIGAWLAVAGYGTGIGLTAFAGLFTVTMLGTAFVVTGLNVRDTRSDSGPGSS